MPDPFDTEHVRSAALTFAVGMEAVAEANRAHDLHPNRDIIDGTGRGTGRQVIRELHRRMLQTSPMPPIADIARERCNAASHTPLDSWERILTEEFFEALEEEAGSQALRAELIQVAAVAINWIRDIDDRDTDIEED